MYFDDYYFLDIYFENNKNNEGFIANIMEGDKIYKELLPFILRGKADSMTELGVDELIVPTRVYSKIQNKIYQLTANTVFKKKNDKKIICYAGSVQIDKVCINNINPMNVIQLGEKTIIKNCNIVLQYQTNVIGVCNLE